MTRRKHDALNALAREEWVATYDKGHGCSFAKIVAKAYRSRLR
jgi:hypothetical protein